MPIRRPDHGCHGYSSSQNSVPWAFSSLVVQHDQAPRLNRIQATSTRGVRARIRRVAGCAPPTGSAGHAGATANLKLTFHLDHSAGADHGAASKCFFLSPPAISGRPPAAGIFYAKRANFFGGASDIGHLLDID